MKTPALAMPFPFTRPLSVLGGALLLVTAVISPDRAWANTLLASYYLITLGLGGAVFLALTRVCGATWHLPFRRVPVALTGLLPVAGLLVLASLGFRLTEYGWHHHGAGDAGTFWFKEFWLNPPFFAARAVIYVLLWIGLARLLVGSSRRRQAALKQMSMPIAIVFLAVFAVTMSLAGIDWIMALEPLWFSTMWGVYQFSGLMMAALSAIILASVTLRKRGFLIGRFSDDHLHDLGRLLIGFSCFWMYIWFSQYMLIWYSNIPEETSYFILRTRGSWGPVVVGVIVLNWVVPFFVLLPRTSKRSETVMVRVAGIVLIGRWLDLYVMIFPPVTGTTAVFGVPEVAGFCLIVGLAVWLFSRDFATADPVPQNDPVPAESLHYHDLEDRRQKKTVFHS